MSLPTSGYISDNARTEGEVKTALEDQRDFIEALLGGKAEGAYVISSGVITPDQTAVFSVDTQGGAGSDDLDRIATTNFSAGALIVLHQLAGSKDVTMRHMQGGDGQLELIGAANYNLAEADVYSAFILIPGSPNKWREVERWFGNQHAQFRTFRGFGSVATLNRGTTVGQSPAQVPAIDDIVGRQSIWIPITSMFVPAASGAAAPVAATGVNSVEVITSEFPDALDRSLAFSVVFPKAWNKGAVRFRYYWGVLSVSTNSVVFGLQGSSAGNGEQSPAYGTVVKVTDANTGNLNQNVSAESADVTISGSPADGDVCFFKITRFAASDANDNLAANVGLTGIELYYTTNAVNDN